jgi:hypothetical protein
VFLAGGVAVTLVGLARTQGKDRFRSITRFLTARLKGLPGAEEAFNANALGGTTIPFAPLALILFCYSAVENFLGQGNGSWICARGHRFGRSI